MRRIKTVEEMTNEKAQVIQDLSDTIDNFVSSLEPRLDEALVAMLALVVYKLKEELSEEKFKQIQEQPLQEVLNSLVHDSVLLSYKKQARETN